MYRVMLVEDETLIRAGFRSSLDWEQFDLEIVAEASDGEEGFKLALEHRPQLIFTDVRMPIADGIQMSERILQELPDTKIVIVSGYDDYAYIRQSMLLGLCDYLVKPVEEDELQKVVEKIIHNLKQEQQNQMLEIEKRFTVDKSKKMIFAEVLNQVVTGNTSMLAIKKYEELRSWFQFDRYALAVLRIENFYYAKNEYYSGDEEALLYTVENITMELLTGNTMLFPKAEIKKEWILLRGLQGDDYEAGFAEFEQECRRIVNVFSSFRKLKINITLGRMVETAEEISSSYQEAVSAMELMGFHDFYFVKKYDPSFNKTFKRFYKDYEALYTNLLNQMNTIKVQELFHIWFHDVKIERDYPRKYVYQDITDFLRMTEQVLERKRNEMQETAYSYDLFALFARFESLNELEDWFLNTVLYQMEVSKKHLMMDSKDIMIRMKSFIQEQYKSDDITLGNLSKRFYLNPYRICRLFKAQFGENFQSYVIQLKIEKAKDYLDKSAMTVQEISGLVGYQDAKYFFRIFKKYTGITPTEYRLKRACPISL
jgi:two-component system response regulator YesN